MTSLTWERGGGQSHDAYAQFSPDLVQEDPAVSKTMKNECMYIERQGGNCDDVNAVMIALHNPCRVRVLRLSSG